MKKKTGLAEKGKAWRIATYVLLLFMILIAVFPAIWMLSTAIKSPVELYDMPPEIIPDEPTLGNFVSVLQNSKMYRAFFNSVVITISVVALTLFFPCVPVMALRASSLKAAACSKSVFSLDR